MGEGAEGGSGEEGRGGLECQGILCGFGRGKAMYYEYVEDVDLLAGRKKMKKGVVLIKSRVATTLTLRVEWKP